MKLKVTAGLLLVLVVVLTAFYMLNTPGARGVAYPAPNGFDAVVEAGHRMTPLPMDFDSSQDTEVLRNYLDANTEPLALLDRAFGQAYLTRMQEDHTTDDILEQTGDIRNAARLLFVRARLAELDGRSGDAADSLTKIAVIGRRVGNGGLMVHQLVAIAIERQGIEGLMQLAHKLSAAEKSNIISLIQAENKNDPALADKIDAIQLREQDNVKRQQGTLIGSFLIWQLAGSDPVTKQYDDLRDKISEADGLRQDLLDAFAAPSVDGGDGQL